MAIMRGFDADAEKIAAEVVNKVGPGGNFLTEEHTVKHFRKELWMSGPPWTRQSWDGWQGDGKKTMGDRIKEQVKEILADHKPDVIDKDLSREIDLIMERAREELS
ncbi:MAG: trimethylamine methyltransferase family protein [Desulfobacteraceae bacterium]|nr:trimethylamine methyltransferase family protein [Desulfobacteraceae bacterium]